MPIPPDDRGGTVTGPRAGAGQPTRLSAEELKAKRSTPLTPNQKRKLRKKLSKLFHVGGADVGARGVVGMASSDFSGTGDDGSGVSISSQQPGTSGNAHATSLACDRPQRPCKRPRTQAPQGARAHGHAGSMHCMALEADDSGSVHLHEGGAQGTSSHHPPIPQLSAAAGPRPASCDAQVTPHTVHACTAATMHRRDHAPARFGHRRGTAPDLSAMMPLISAELRACVAAGPAPPPGPTPARCGGFCRVNLSTEVSVISAELSASAADGSGSAECDGSVGGCGGARSLGCASGGQLDGRDDDEAARSRGGGCVGSGGSGGGGGADRACAPTAMQSGEPPSCSAAPAAGANSTATTTKKKKKKQFVHGNYHNYYGYRALGSFDDDPRLRLLKAAWFRGRDVLDIGCNEGIVTLAVAAGFCAGRTTGVDIDAALVRRCAQNLREVRALLAAQLQGRGAARGGSGDSADADADDAGRSRSHAASLARAMVGATARTLAHASASSGGGEGADGASVAAGGSGMSGALASEAGADAAATKLDADGDSAADVRDCDEGDAHASLVGDSAAAAATAAAAAAAAAPRVAEGRGGDASCCAGPSASAPGADAMAPKQRLAALRAALKSLGRTKFQHQDWARTRTRAQSFDTLLCLSVTKWVHLNGGDAALARLFRKMHDSLVPGGLLVLEPQQWRSYQSAVRKPQTARGEGGRPRDLDALALRPEAFLEHLHTTYGFVMLEDLNSGSSSFHFDRPMYVLQRPPALPRQLQPDTSVAGHLRAASAGTCQPAVAQ